MTRRVLVIGRSGQLARELSRAAWPAGWSVSFASAPDCDLRLPEQAAAAVLAAKPDIVVNAAAYTQVDQAETETELARLVNATGPAAVAAACARLGVPFLTVSTDYVFNGAKRGAYVEDDPVDPVGAYGRTKAEGEALIRAATAQHVILRTSWVFSPFGTNFVRTMMRFGAERPILKIVADQHGRPTYAGDLAGAIVEICAALQAGTGAYGTFHAANEGPTTWHAFAVAIFQGLAARGERVPQQVAAITTAEYPTKAVRPANSVLDCTRLSNTFGVALRPWRDALDDCLSELVGRKTNVRV
jgi:dTDP-4-dehydrorhamnose reductase